MIVLLGIVVAASAVEPDAPLASVEDVLATFAQEPAVGQVQDWAQVWAGTDPARVRRWLAESRSFARLPEVTLEAGLDLDQDQGFLYLDADGLTPVPGVVPLPVIDDAGQSRSVDLGVVLRWDLSKLVTSSERIRMISEARALEELRREVRTEVTRLYFERRRAQVERLLAPRPDPMGRVEEELRIAELGAEIDALTGGAFGAALAREGSGG